MDYKTGVVNKLCNVQKALNYLGSPTCEGSFILGECFFLKPPLSKWIISAVFEGTWMDFHFQFQHKTLELSLIGKKVKRLLSHISKVWVSKPFRQRREQL